jgi:gluconokinase
MALFRHDEKHPSEGRTAATQHAYVVMGIASCGKSVIGRMLADDSVLGCRFYEGDEYHSEESLDKMKKGTPLTDEDRRPWLERLSKVIFEEYQAGKTCVVACSALKQAYRHVLKQHVPEGYVRFIWLDIDASLAQDRCDKRHEDHFFPSYLIASQLSTLDMTVDEAFCHVSIYKPDTTIDDIIQYITSIISMKG